MPGRPDLNSLRALIVEVGRRAYERGLISALEGNFSLRLPDGTILATPAGMCKGRMQVQDIVLCDRDGRKLEGTRQPPTELAMHLRVYDLRPDVQAIAHCHPPTATGYAVAGMPLDKPTIAEVVAALGQIPLARYGTPSTEELPDSLEPLIPCHDAILLSNHGAIAYGKDLEDAYYKMETIEHFARISLAARTLGRERVLTSQEVNKLYAIRERYGIAPPAPECVACPVMAGDLAQDGETVTLTRDELKRLIREAVDALTRPSRS